MVKKSQNLVNVVCERPLRAGLLHLEVRKYVKNMYINQIPIAFLLFLDLTTAPNPLNVLRPMSFPRMKDSVC